MKDYTVVLYHADCPDGFGAAWVAWMSLGSCVAYIPARYGDLPPNLTSSDRVLIVDFSYPRAVLEKLRASVAELVILDHHKSAAEDLKDFRGATFDMEKSGARLAWEHFNPSQPPPALISYVEDRDLWRWKLPWSKKVSAFILSFDFDFLRWDIIAKELRDSLDACVSEGSAIMRERERAVEMLCANSGLMDVGGYYVPVVNTACYISEVANRLCEKHPTAPFAACYFDTQGSHQRKWSLRSINGFDVSAVAKKFGGGGHPAAAGFSADL